MFDSRKYVGELANELIRSFSNAQMGTTPQLIGTAKEKATSDKLESLLPNFVGVGSGCVIDIYGNVSKQCDIVIFEKEFYPRFSINGNSGTTYYPCESVIAVGEIKSSLDTKQLKDSFEKIKSVKKLKRDFVIPETTEIGGYEFRHYGSKLIASGAQSEAYIQQENFRDQIYGFIFVEKISLKMETFLNKYSSLVKQEEDYLLPNITLSLNEGVFVYMNAEDNKIYPTKRNATVIQNLKIQSGDFQYLLVRLGNIIYSGRTTNVIPFIKYIQLEISYTINGPSKLI